MSERTEAREKKYREIYELAQQGMTKPMIAEKLFCGVSTVDRAIREMGGIARKSFKRNQDEAIRLWNAGWTADEIGVKVGMSGQSIRKNLRKLGYTRANGQQDIPEGCPIEEGREVIGSAGRAGRMRKYEEDEEPIPTQFVVETRRTKRITVHGRTMQDVSDWFL